MIGLFTEIGPFALNEQSVSGTAGAVPSLFRNPFAWNQNTTLLFWESPSPVGFSYCTDKDKAVDNSLCPQWNDTSCAEENFAFLKSFFGLYPEYSKNAFYMFGESYAGVYSEFDNLSGIFKPKNRTFYPV